MRKADIIMQVADRLGMSKTEVKCVLDGVLHNIIEANKAGEKVVFRGFGCFWPRKNAERLARNMENNTAIRVPAHYKPSFTPSKEFTKQVKEALQSRVYT